MVVPHDSTHGVQLFADVNVTLHVALERSVVESAAPAPVKPGWSNASMTVFPSGRDMTLVCLSVHFF